MDKKKLTIKDLIAKKEAIKDQSKILQLYVKSLDGLITIQKPSRQLCLDAIEMGNAEGDAYLVYNSVVEPNLKDKELQDAFGCVSPLDIVEAIFEPGEIVSIAKECLVFAGYGDNVKLVDEIKN
ncbi:hypothetical protein BR63_19205 [Thermanaerosceptrum fracticalcis]|uniref:Phage portal protein n=1 Tax=Thermanaerosceptrum fracticalcis TaxID=1712410 RepID=A0A7G6E806_THEFR|nr:hypothetical protein [Thermanaerosceptrum fracticalcis]QNB48210.1 hypothetical protein BR63_19205 [Thermanaerosceptrum fracticalcis]